MVVVPQTLLLNHRCDCSVIAMRDCEMGTNFHPGWTESLNRGSVVHGVCLMGCDYILLFRWNFDLQRFVQGGTSFVQAMLQQKRRPRAQSIRLFFLKKSEQDSLDCSYETFN